MSCCRLGWKVTSCARDSLVWVSLGLAGTGWSLPSLAFEVNEKLEINGMLAGAGQCQELSASNDADDACRGGLVFQPEITYTPTGRDEIFAKFGFGVGNGLNEVSPFVLSPWAAGLQDEVKDINGRNRSYLLEVWYAHSVEINEDNSIQFAGGIIDPTYYVNENAYANDEFVQFMNGVFVNSPALLLPAYDWGGALVWEFKDLTLSALGMNVGDNDDGNDYNWYAVEIDYELDIPLGEGHYRVTYAVTDSEFPDPERVTKERLEGSALSFDQELGSNVGVFLRLGWQAEDAAVDYKAVYSGGLDIKGATWGRESDNAGIGYGYLEGGNGDISRTNVFEAYYRFVVNDYLALTADVQYMSDDYSSAERGADDDVQDQSGWVLGVRAVVEL